MEKLDSIKLKDLEKFLIFVEVHYEMFDYGKHFICYSGIHIDLPDDLLNFNESIGKQDGYSYQKRGSIEDIYNRWLELKKLQKNNVQQKKTNRTRSK